jgi:hypothetical protein
MARGATIRSTRPDAAAFTEQCWWAGVDGAWAATTYLLSMDVADLFRIYC